MDNSINHISLDQPLKIHLLNNFHIISLKYIIFSYMKESTWTYHNVDVYVLLFKKLIFFYQYLQRDPEQNLKFQLTTINFHIQH